MCDTSMMPLRVAMPNSVMNPIIVATLRTPPARNTPATPPISASGRFTMTSNASRARPNASTSSMNSPAIDADAQDQQPLRRALLAFELPAVLDAVARRHRHRLGHRRLNVLDDAAEIAAGDVARDDDAALNVLAQDHVRPLLAPHVGEQPDRHAARRSACRSAGRRGARNRRADAGSNFTTRSNAVPRSKMRPTVAPAKLVSIASATSSARRP